MPPNQSQTATLTNTQTSPIEQTITYDYTGIYCLCGTVLLLGILFICVINFWVKRFYRHKLAIDTTKLNLECANYSLMVEKIDNLIKLQKEINESIKRGI